ncbi:MAG TPA: methyl-accepting chemotaxis protein [Noviherbaspirillum sp.]|uniref:methyl-accepting chemotaxis protein n=1 Tax=Noviherbaspirillum sp. TaxID=1926288 RepID=UPI002B49BD1F|nr:methyl-accepting chemotaxis protein [Noviherbaspirillum sp.]HJV84633.1 methyl-accepting chemotaxis protein [Noviherbaspirillum sp.]
MKLSNLKIGTRLYGGFSAVVLLMIILLSVAYANFSRLGQANFMNIHTYQVLEEVKGMLSSLIDIETGQRGFSLSGRDSSLEPLKAGENDFKVHWDKARSLTSDNPKQQERLTQLFAAQQKWMSDAIDPAIALRRDIESGKAKMDAVVELERAAKGKQAMDSMRVLIADLDKEERQLLGVRAKDAQDLQSLTGSTMIGGGMLGMVLAAVLAVWLTRNITRPMSDAVEMARRVAKGDLTAHINTTATDETGQLIGALCDMNESLARIVAEVRRGTDQIFAASSQISDGNMDLSSRTEQQASSLEETASSMEELTSTVQQNAENARQANTLAMSTSQIAQRGGAVVSEVVSTMGAINESAKKIVDIIAVIDGIAFQTNILALNAAVEAARAGDQGRGFAVVAAEVRNLAQRSAAAAREIKALIGDSVEKVDAGSKLVDQAGTTMEEVVSSVKHVAGIIAEIAAASDEQRNGIEQVNQAITQMDNVTQQNAALVEEAAAAAGAMQDQASSLAEMVALFTIDSTQLSNYAGAGGVLGGPQMSQRARAIPASQSSASRERKAKALKSLQQAKTTVARNPLVPRNVSMAKATATAGDDWQEF